MSDSLAIAAMGMQAQQLNLDTIANNVVNMNTPGFKKARVSFTELMMAGAAPVASMGGPALDGTSSLGALAALPREGAGVAIAGLPKLFDMGVLTPTASLWDVAIQGDGFLQVAMPDGTTGYYRGGTLKVTKDGQLATQSGIPLKPGITIPSDATNLAIAQDGTVWVTVPRQSAPLQAGQIQLARFANPGALVAQGDNLYRASEEAGEPLTGQPGQDGLGTLQQGMLEGSNVKMTDELVNLMLAQRSYEASVRVAQASDEVLGMINNLRK